MVDPRYLQIDHRIPYAVAGDVAFDDHDVEAYMLLDASSQRAKSWSCENCQNFLETLDPNIYWICLWASPESYSHVALEEVRRLDVAWRGSEVRAFDMLRERAAAEGITLQDLVKRLAAQG